MTEPDASVPLGRFSGLVTRYQSIRTRVASAPWLVPVVAIAVAIGIGFSWIRLDIDLSTLELSGLALSAVLAVPAALLSATEFLLAQRIAGTRTTFRTAVNVSLMGSLANLLPIPGGAIVRVDAMTNSGSRLGTAIRTTMGIGLVWVGLAVCGSGIAVFVLDRPGTGSALIAIGVVVSIAGVISLRLRGGTGVWLGLLVLAVELAVVGVATWRIHLVLSAIGEDPTWTQALGLVASGAVAVAVGLVPAGLGVRELLAALLAPLVGLPPAAGFLTAGINQVLSLIGQGALAMAVWARRA